MTAPLDNSLLAWLKDPATVEAADGTEGRIGEEDLPRLAVETLGEAVWISCGSPLELSKDRLLFSNDVIQRLTGYRIGEIARYGWPLLLGEQTIAASFSQLERAVESGCASQQRFLVERRDGTRFWGKVELRPVAQKPDLWVTILHDLGQPDLQGDDPSRERDSLVEALHGISEAVLNIDAGGLVTFCNKVAEEWTGWREAEIVGQSWSNLLRLLDAQRRPLSEADLDFESLMEVGTAKEVTVVRWIESRYRLLRPVALRLIPLRDHRRLIGGATLVFHPLVEPDLGSREASHGIPDRTLGNAAEVLNASVEALGAVTSNPGDRIPLAGSGLRPGTAAGPRLGDANLGHLSALEASSIAHDFNNLLTGIMGNLAMLRRQTFAPEQTDAMLGVIETATRRAQELSQRLMQVGREVAPRLSVVAVPEVIRECIGFIVAGTTCRLKAEIAANLWPARADDGQLCQVVNNLLVNATEAMPHGGSIRVTARNLPSTEEVHPGLPMGNYVEIEVADAGPGIPPEILNRVFDPYFSTKQRGSGLGLANCRTLIRRMGGEITVQSPPEHGAIFRVFVPAEPGAVATPAHASGRDGLQDLHGKGRVLVIDDEAMIRQITCDMLTHLGYMPEPVADFDAALAAVVESVAAEVPFCVALLDLSIVSAPEAATAADRLRSGCPDLQVILSSGYDAHPLMRSATTHGFAAAIGKPYNIHRLANLINEVTQHATHRLD